jgi:hypothetical protein
MSEISLQSASGGETEGEDEGKECVILSTVNQAKDERYLCYPFTSEEWHGLCFLRPSRFIEELPENTYEEFVVNDK